MSDFQTVLEGQTAKVLDELAVQMGLAVPTGDNKAKKIERILARNDEDIEGDEDVSIFDDFIEACNQEAETAGEGEATTSTKGKIRPIPTRGAGDLICKAIQEYMADDAAIDETEIIASVKNAFPNQNPDSKAIAYYKTLLRNNGVDVPKGKPGKPVAEPANEDEAESEAAA